MKTRVIQDEPEPTGHKTPLDLCSNQGIADKLVITVRAVEKYVSSIFGKLGLPSTGSESRRVLAVLTFLRS